MNDPTQQPPIPFPVSHQPKPTMPTATAFSDMWKDVGRFEPLGFNAGRGVEGVGGTSGYEYAERMGMVV